MTVPSRENSQPQKGEVATDAHIQDRASALLSPAQSPDAMVDISGSRAKKARAPHFRLSVPLIQEIDKQVSKEQTTLRAER